MFVVSLELYIIANYQVICFCGQKIPLGKAVQANNHTAYRKVFTIIQTFLATLPYSSYL